MIFSGIFLHGKMLLIIATMDMQCNFATVLDIHADPEDLWLKSMDPLVP
jgi:hypothetical protein